MKATGIVRRIDDLGRVVIPKEIRHNMKISEGEPLEIFIEDDSIIFKKYSTDGKKLAENCADWVNENKNSIVLVMSIGDKTVCAFKTESGSLTAEVSRHSSDTFDLNIAICYCAVKCGFYVEGI